MSTTPYHILIVDDNPEFVQSLKSLILDVAGSAISEVVVAYNGHDGLELMRDREFDFVFMDINMPRIDGISATRFARYEYGKPEMKIIGISFNSEFRFKSQMIRAGADCYLIKDEIDADKLLEILNINQNNPTIND